MGLSDVENVTPVLNPHTKWLIQKSYTNWEPISVDSLN